MSYTQTPNYALYKPTINSDNDQWGTHLNANADTLDSTLHTISGTVPAPATTTPPMDGTGTAGVAMLYARQDHQHPTDTTRAPLANPTFTGTVTIPAGATITGYAPLASPTFTGNPSLPTGTTAVTQAVGDNTTAPATDAFVQAAVAPAFNNTGRNLVHNGTFVVAQRGANPTITNWGYTLDRWAVSFTGDTMTISQNPLLDTDRAQIGDESAQFYFRNAFTGTSAAAAYNFAYQAIESVRRLSNKTVTVSFYANASVALRLGVSIDQYFGTGGSPSAQVNGNGQSVTLSTTWQRFSLTFTISSVSGKTLGTAGNDSTILNFWYSSGTTNATRAGSVGVQSGTVALWGVQLEIGTAATPLAKRDPADDIATCQRFYQVGATSILGYAGAGSFVGYFCPFPVVMRAIPTVTLGTVVGSDTNISAVTTDLPATWGFRFYLTATATGYASAARNFTASADL